MILERDFPQADKLSQIGMVAVAVANGKASDDEIEGYLGLHSDGRQGRYYRRAAITLGLIESSKNQATLTAKGKVFVSLGNAHDQIDFLGRCLIDAPVFRKALSYIGSSSPNESELKDWFINFYPGAESTARRRYSSFFHHLIEAGLIKKGVNGFQLLKYGSAVEIANAGVSDGIAGNSVVGGLKNLPSKSADEISEYFVDKGKLANAISIHWNLVVGKAGQLQSAGMTVKENRSIDLFSESLEIPVIYEMKSMNAKNDLSQIRKAVSQLYEYRYLFAVPEAKLCIVGNRPVPKEYGWVLNYLESDRGIAYEWSDDFKNFSSSEKSKELLGGYAP